jgi:hypothetical protein
MVRLKPLSYAFTALILFALLSPHNEAIYEHFGIIPKFPKNAKGTTSIVRATTTEILMNEEEHNKKKTEQGIDKYLTKIQEEEEEEQISDHKQHKNTREPFILDYNRLKPPIELVSEAALWLHGLHIAREV